MLSHIIYFVTFLLVIQSIYTQTNECKTYTSVKTIDMNEGNFDFDFSAIQGKATVVLVNSDKYPYTITIRGPKVFNFTQNDPNNLGTVHIVETADPPLPRADPPNSPASSASTLRTSVLSTILMISIYFLRPFLPRPLLTAPFLAVLCLSLTMAVPLQTSDDCNEYVVTISMKSKLVRDLKITYNAQSEFKSLGWTLPPTTQDCGDGCKRYVNTNYPCGTARCNDACVDINNDNNHCGKCNSPCNSETGQICKDGFCVDPPPCSFPFGRCIKGSLQCETNIGNDPMNCGNCSVVCEKDLPFSTDTTCVNGECTPICQTSYGNCDGNYTTGCEQYLSSVDHCGECNNNCSVPKVPGQYVIPGTASCVFSPSGFTCDVVTTNNPCDNRLGFCDDQCVRNRTGNSTEYYCGVCCPGAPGPCNTGNNGNHVCQSQSQCCILSSTPCCAVGYFCSYNFSMDTYECIPEMQPEPEPAPLPVGGNCSTYCNDLISKFEPSNITCAEDILQTPHCGVCCKEDGNCTDSMEELFCNMNVDDNAPPTCCQLNMNQTSCCGGENTCIPEPDLHNYNNGSMNLCVNATSQCDTVNCTYDSSSFCVAPSDNSTTAKCATCCPTYYGHNLTCENSGNSSSNVTRHCVQDFLESSNGTTSQCCFTSQDPINPENNQYSCCASPQSCFNNPNNGTMPMNPFLCLNSVDPCSEVICDNGGACFVQSGTLGCAVP